MPWLCRPVTVLSIHRPHGLLVPCRRALPQALSRPRPAGPSHTNDSRTARRVSVVPRSPLILGRRPTAAATWIRQARPRQRRTRTLVILCCIHPAGVMRVHQSMAEEEEEEAETGTAAAVSQRTTRASHVCRRGFGRLALKGVAGCSRSAIAPLTRRTQQPAHSNTLVSFPTRSSTQPQHRIRQSPTTTTSKLGIPPPPPLPLAVEEEGTQPSMMGQLRCSVIMSKRMTRLTHWVFVWLEE